MSAPATSATDSATQPTGTGTGTGVRERVFARLTQPRVPRARAPRVFEFSFSAVGLVLGLYFFALSLTPSLLPRAGYTQGIGSGVAFMIGYGVGAAGYALVRFFGIKPARGRVRAFLLVAAMLIIAVQASFAIWAYVGWQNETRLAFGMEPLDPLVWPVIVAVAALTAAVILVASRALRTLFRWADDLLDHWLPRRLAVTVAAVILISVLWWVASGAFVNAFFTVSNAVFSTRDGQDKPGVTQPVSTLRSGGAESTVAWEDLGRQGRSFVSSGPTAADIADFSGQDAVEPIRAYVGLKSADTLQGRADLLLEELQRTGAFEREVLVVATTTGTGFLDPRGVDPVEYMFGGDTAIAGVQYSYLPSWISLLADQEVVQETSRVVFRTIHEYWSTLPEESRPQLYLYGLSLGSYGVEAVLRSADILNEPISGALMVGPTFVNPMHAELTDSRDPGSPAWLPTVGDGRTVRFTAEEDALAEPSGRWGPTRVAYLQHGSDPVVFFNQRLAFESPAWLEPGQRAPDVAQRMEWYPLVTMWQVLLDLPGAGSVPVGFGHLYSIQANLQAWVGVTDPEGWTATETDRLADFMEDQERQRLEELEGSVS